MSYVTRNYRATFPDALRSEWTKLSSLRSLWFTALATVLIGPGIGSLTARAQGGAYLAGKVEDPASFDPTAVSYGGIFVGQLAIGVLGVLAITSEYATGMIRPSLAAVPRRARLLVAKCVVFAGAAFVLGQLIGFTSFLIGQSMLAALGVPHAGLDQPDVLRAVVGAGLYLATIGLLGLGLGTMLRSTAGAIGLLVTIILLVRAVSLAFPQDWQIWINKYWPTSAGEQITRVIPQPGALAPWTGFGLLCGFVLAVAVAGYAVLRGRDA
ncbi:MAG: ABC transporter permease subunit [Pseudonocardiaceae bacterium]|nr:ABC transporter permease subunit [Pseudonocardiaceae bacterium]